LKKSKSTRSFGSKVAPAPLVENGASHDEGAASSNFENGNDPYQSDLVGKTIMNSNSERQIRYQMRESGGRMNAIVNMNQSKASNSTNAEHYEQKY